MSMIAARWMRFASRRRGSTPTAASYVQSGLIAMWDGEWNAGGGVHDASATTWVDITGNGYDIPAVVDSTFTAYPTWGDLGATKTTNARWRFYRPTGFDDIYTMFEGTGGTLEFCANFSAIDGDGGNGVLFHVTTPSRVIGFDPANNSSAQGMLTVFRMSNWGSYTSSQQSAYLPSGQLNAQVIGLHTSSVAVSSSSQADVYSDAAYKHTLTGDPAYTRTWAGMRITTAAATRGTYHCVRVYNRALTAAEVAANYAIDQQRFGV